MITSICHTFKSCMSSLASEQHRKKTALVTALACGALTYFATHLTLPALTWKVACVAASGISYGITLVLLSYFGKEKPKVQETDSPSSKASSEASSDGFEDLVDSDDQVPPKQLFNARDLAKEPTC